MTATATTPVPAAPSYRVTLPRVLRSEFTKLRTLRSTMWSLLAALALLLGFALLIPSLIVSQWDKRTPLDKALFDATHASLAGAGLAQLAIGVLGVLVISGEYSTGMIRASVTAVPARLPMLWGKVIVFGATMLAVTIPTLLGAFFIGQAVFSSKHADAHLSEPGVARVVFGTALYLTAVGLLGLSLGALLRHSAGAIAALVGMLLVLPIVFFLLPSSISRPVAKYLPGRAAEAMTQLHPESSSLGPWTGFGVFCLYWVTGLAAAAWLLRKRDA